jgi:hypothetical protein
VIVAHAAQPPGIVGIMIVATTTSIIISTSLCRPQPTVCCVIVPLACAWRCDVQRLIGMLLWLLSIMDIIIVTCQCGAHLHTHPP